MSQENFMEYANKTNSNVIPKRDFQHLAKQVFEVIAENLSNSLGPLGSSTTILQGMYTDSTKDGYTIFKNYRFRNNYKTMIYNLMKNPCTALNNTVGDGTTTAIVMTDYLFKEYQEKKHVLETFYRLPREFTKAWDEIIHAINEKVASYSTMIDPSDYETIYNLAYVVSNGNEEISRNFADIYQNSKSPVVKWENSPTNKSYVKPINGFNFPANLISGAYARTDDLTVNTKELVVMIFDHKIQLDFFEKFIIPINETIKSLDKRLLIIAPFYDSIVQDGAAKQYANSEYQRNGEPMLRLAVYENSKLYKDQLEDLAVVLRTKVIREEDAVQMFESFPTDEADRDNLIEDCVNNVIDATYLAFQKVFGTAASATLSCKKGSIFQVNNIEEEPEYQDALRAAEAILNDAIANTDFEKQSYAIEVGKARTRISQLQMENYIYYVGADSTLQKRIIEDAVEDVTKCLRSAIKSGVVPGCQLSIIRAANEVLNDISAGVKETMVLQGNTQTPTEIPDALALRATIIRMISAAVVATYGKVLSGPDNTGIMKMVENWQHYKADEESENALYAATNKKANEILNESIKRNMVFDLETMDYSDKIITSAETDIMVLTASSELVKILISGNTCVVVDANLDDTHEETRQVHA